MEAKYLFGLTIHGIQNYIFNTNALTEIIGASEVIEKISTKIINEILPETSFSEENLFLAAAGNIRYLCNEKDAKVLYEKFPEKIKKIAGNITFSQAVVKVEGDLNQDHFIKLETNLRANKNRPAIDPDVAFMTRTINRRTGEPTFVKSMVIDEYYDYTTKQKIEHKDAKLVLDKISTDNKWVFPKEISDISNTQNKSYVAVVHIDGNKLGATIQDILNSEIQNKPELLKKLSIEIEKSTVTAFKNAFNQIIVKNQNFKTEKDKNGADTHIVPLRPVILGGDDLTLIIRANLAIEFTNEYLKEFEKATKENFKNLGLIKGLTATAGIVFIKQKYPFHYGVHLAEKITTYAKDKTRREKSSLSFYKVQDSFVNNYKDIVDRELKPNGFDFENGPYDFNNIDDLLNKVKIINQDDVSSGAFRELLSLIYESEDKADFRWTRIKEIQNLAIKKLQLKPNLKENKILYDLITLDSLTTDN